MEAKIIETFNAAYQAEVQFNQKAEPDSFQSSLEDQIRAFRKMRQIIEQIVRTGDDEEVTPASYEHFAAYAKAKVEQAATIPEWKDKFPETWKIKFDKQFNNASFTDREFDEAFKKYATEVAAAKAEAKAETKAQAKPETKPQAKTEAKPKTGPTAAEKARELLLKKKSTPAANKGGRGGRGGRGAGGGRGRGRGRGTNRGQ